MQLTLSIANIVFLDVAVLVFSSTTEHVWSENVSLSLNLKYIALKRRFCRGDILMTEIMFLLAYFVLLEIK